jgi:hypothetical protein
MKALSIALLTSAMFLVLAQPVVAAEESWTDRITFNGDVRFRFESIDEDTEVERERNRFRARFGFTAKVQDDFKVVIQLASGGDNPVSTNQSIDGGFSRKDIGLDLAYVDWKINDAFTLNAGKIKNPFFKAGKVPLIWDSDLNPEGLAAKFSSGMFFGTAGFFTVEERSSSDDSLLYAVQGGVKFPLTKNLKLTAGAGYFTYTNTIGNEPFFDGNPRGNSVDADGNYVYDYENTEVFAQLDTSVADWPLQIFAHYTQNGGTSVEDTAFAYGAKLGSAKDKGQTEFGWIYQDLEADSVIGTFADSDFGGGGTDSSGHMLKAKYAFSKKIFLGGTYFINKKDRFQDVERDYNRLQIDIEFKFN